MASYVECPTEWDGVGTGVFLAGGISGCPNWQAEAVEQLSDTGLVLVNPRRQNFPMNDPPAAPAQIEWEYRHLRMVHARLFWFPAQTLCPIALFELGAWTRDGQQLFVGAHPDYERRTDVVIQTWLARPDVAIAASGYELCQQVRKWAQSLAVVHSNRED